MAEPPAPRRRWLEAAVVAALAAGLVYCGGGVWHDRGFPARFGKVHLGMDRKAAIALLGGPDWEGACGSYRASLPRADCAREIVYASAFAPLVRAHHSIQLDRSGRVIEAETIP